MKVHIERLPEALEEVGDELGTPVRCSVGGNFVFRKNVKYEKLSKFGRIDGIISGNENALFGKSVYNYENRSKTIGRGKMFNKVHRNRRPRKRRNRKLMKQTIWFVPRRFGVFAYRAQIDIIFDKGTHARPNIVAPDQFQCLVLSEVSSEQVIVLVLEDSEA